jgi:PAS domain S-box-containing protein
MAIPKGQSNKKHSKVEQPEADQLNHDELKKVHEHSPMGVLAIDARGIVVYANSAATTSTGLDASGLVGKSLSGFCEDTSPGKVNQAKLRDFEEITDQEFLIKTKSGRRWVLLSSKVYRDAASDDQTYLFVRDISALKKRENLFANLNEAATALATTRDTAGALEQISRFIVPKFADWFTIDQLKDNKIELLFLKHQDPAKVDWAYQYRQAYPPDLNSNAGSAVVIKTGKPGFVPVVTEEMIDALITDPVQRREVKKIGLHSAIIMPMSANGKITGVVNFISSEPGRYFDETDLEFAKNFAGLIGLSLENARLNEDAAREIALRKQSEEAFRFLTDAIPHKVWTSGPDGRATYYNRRWYEYTGIEGFEALRAKIWDFIHPDDRARAEAEWPKAVASGEPMEIEHRLLRQNGDYRWHLSSFNTYKNEDGETTLGVGASTDIHDQKTAGIELASVNEELRAANEELAAMNEEASAANEELVAMNEEVAATNEELASANEDLAEANGQLVEAKANVQRSEKLFRSIAINIPKSLIIVIDRDHRYITIEGDIMEKMGYDRKDYEGKHPLETGPPERYEDMKPLYDRMMAGAKFSVERRAETGEYFMVHFVPLREENKAVERGLIIALDITDIRHAEEKSVKLASIVESTDDAIVSKTLESVITSWNNAAERMFGFTADEIIGETIYKIIPPDRLDEEPHILERLKKGERVEHFETKRLTKAGRLLDVSLTVSPLRDARGKIIGLSKIARDITEKKLEEQRKNDFIGMVSHELKTPLTTLSAIVQVAGARLKDNEDAFLATAMDRVNQQVKKMTGMVNGFLNIARLEAGKMLIEKKPFYIDDLLREILDETKLIVTTHAVTLAGSGRAQVNADWDKISSVISNLISNAVKYSPRRKPVELAYQVKGGEVIVSVKDEGIGIGPQDHEKVFDRYFRVETNDTQHISGFGIGLYLSAEIIKRHDGRIWVESDAGKGAAFYFTLPLMHDK